MAERDDFTDDEWFELHAAPWRTAMGVIEVDPSGALTTGSEVEAVEAKLAGSQFDEGLVGLVTRDVLDLDQVGGEDKPSAGPTAAVAEAADEEGDFADRVIAAMGALNAILDAKVDADEAAAFRRWLVEVAEAAAEAGREGLAGLTGPRVSDSESGYLDRLRTALGVS
jgi:hypothetical protein